MNKKYVLWGVIGAIVLAVFWGISLRNGFVVQEENINSSWAQVENQLKRRYDLIPNLVNTVKGVASQEKEVFGNIAEARARLAGAKQPSEVMSASNEMESAISRLLVVMENYPQLRSVESYNRLMDELAGSENRIAVERQRYNEQVEIFNKKIKVFPASLIAGLMSFEKHPYFDVSEKESQAPSVQFN